MTGPFGAPGVQDDLVRHPQADKGSTMGNEPVKVNRPTSLAEAVADKLRAQYSDPEAYAASETARAKAYRDAMAQHFRESNARVAAAATKPATHQFGGAA